MDHSTLLRYPQNISDTAEAFFVSLFIRIPNYIFALEKINLIVVGAGAFPSFVPLVEKLSKHGCQLTAINLTLIDPDNIETNIFKDYFLKWKRHQTHKIRIRITVKIHQIDIKKYLLQNKLNHHFDIIYFEHPDLSIFHTIGMKLKIQFHC